MWTDTLGLLVAAFFLLSVLSMLWKDNFFFRFGQQAIIGGTIAHAGLFNMKSVISSALVPISQGDLVPIIPVVLGILMYARLKKETAWMSKYATSVLIGVGLGVMIAGTLDGQIISQVKQSLVDMATSSAAGNTLSIFNSVLILVGMVTSISFFLFTREQTGWFNYITRIGRVFLMVSLGANWSGEFIWYLAQLIGRLSFLINNVIKALLFGG
jgi:hypothetical protein